MLLGRRPIKTFQDPPFFSQAPEPVGFLDGKRSDGVRGAVVVMKEAAVRAEEEQNKARKKLFDL